MVIKEIFLIATFDHSPEKIAYRKRPSISFIHKTASTSLSACIISRYCYRFTWPWKVMKNARSQQNEHQVNKFVLVDSLSVIMSAPWIQMSIKIPQRKISLIVLFSVWKHAENENETIFFEFNLINQQSQAYWSNRCLDEMNYYFSSEF